MYRCLFGSFLASWSGPVRTKIWLIPYQNIEYIHDCDSIELDTGSLV